MTPPLALPIDHPGWRFFSDRVMGGVSDGEAKVEKVAGRRAIQLRGTVSLDHGVAFLQVACPLGTSSDPVFDASTLAGIELDVLAASDDAFEADLAVARIALVEGDSSPQGRSRRTFPR